MSSDNGNQKFNAETGSIGDDHNGQHLHGTVQHLIHETVCQRREFSDGQEVLMPDVPHSEEERWNEGNHHGEHGALQVDSVLDMHARIGRAVGNEQERFKRLESPIERVQLATFLKERLDLVELIFNKLHFRFILSLGFR